MQNISTNPTPFPMIGDLATETAAGAAKVKRDLVALKAAIVALTAGLGGATAVVGGISAFVGYKAVKPRRRVMTDDTLAAHELPPEKVSFQSLDKLPLKGYFYPVEKPRGTMLVSHGFHGCSADMHEAAVNIQQAGYNALTFDFRGCGESGGQTTSVGYYEVRDLLGAIEYLKTRPDVDPAKIGAYGISMGGAVSILAAAVSTDIKVLVTDAAFASLDNVLAASFSHFYRLPRIPFRLTAVAASRMFSRTLAKRVHPMAALKKLAEQERHLPIMIMHGAKDRAIPVSEANILYELATGPRELWIHTEANHVVGLYAGREEYCSRIAAFLQQHL